jgi:hypothetical protein
MTLDSESKRNVLAWLLLVSTLAIHVLDEALADFLPFWNQLVTDLKAEIGFVPLPTFSFGTWIGGLITAVIIGYALTPLVARGGQIMRVLLSVVGVVMVANGFGHLFGSWYFETWLPGVRSSPILLIASVYMLFRTQRGDWRG